MIAKCIITGFGRHLSDQTATRSFGKYGDMVNIYCEKCERHHMAHVKGTSEYAKEW